MVSQISGHSRDVFVADSRAGDLSYLILNRHIDEVAMFIHTSQEPTFMHSS